MTAETWRPSRVFILYPAGASSGGPEALHQLCDAVRGVGVDSALVPLNWPDAGQDTSAFDKYHCPVRDAVPDEPDVAVVVPDVALSYVSRFRRARPVVWWLSIDFSELYGPRMARARKEISWGGAPQFVSTASWRRGIRSGVGPGCEACYGRPATALSRNTPSSTSLLTRASSTLR